MCMSLIRNHCHHLVVAHDIIRIITQDQSTTPPLNLYELSDFLLKTLRPLLAKWCCLGILMSGVVLSSNVFSHDRGTCSRRSMDPFFFYISGSPIRHMIKDAATAAADGRVSTSFEAQQSLSFI